MNDTSDTNAAKNRLRRKVWELLDAQSVGRTGPVRGQIPNFHGADRAARLLAEHPGWAAAGVKCGWGRAVPEY